MVVGDVAMARSSRSGVSVRVVEHGECSTCWRRDAEGFRAFTIFDNHGDIIAEPAPEERDGDAVVLAVGEFPDGVGVIDWGHPCLLDAMAWSSAVLSAEPLPVRIGDAPSPIPNVSRRLRVRSVAMPAPAELPTGTVTFVFTEMEGSTRLRRELGRAAYGELLARHNQILRTAFTEHGGVEVDRQGV